MVIPLILMRKDLSFKKTSAYALSAFVACWAIWMLFGFPQYFSSQYFIPPVLHSSDPYHLSIFLNYASKVILAIFFVTLLKVWKGGPKPLWGRKLKSEQPLPPSP